MTDTKNPEPLFPFSKRESTLSADEKKKIREKVDEARAKKNA